jgi:hypothetical protein
MMLAPKRGTTTLKRLLSHAFLVVVCASACSRPAGPISITLVTDPNQKSNTVRVTGLSSAEISSLRQASLSDEQWSALLRVSVANGPAEAPPVIGRFDVTGDAVMFTPRFPFDPGREYRVTFDPSKMPSPRTGSPIATVVSLPAIVKGPSTAIVRMLPSAEVLPENLLRVYLEFSAPMSRENGRDFIRLVDENGREVRDAFLALDIEFWSPDYKRYTVLFDPGRVKQGILPNDQFGRALRAGHKYTIEVDKRWRDADGQPLTAPFRRTFTAGPAEMQPIDISKWTIAPPGAGTRDPLVVRFPKALDHGLLQRAIGVARAGQSDPLVGDIDVGVDEREWRFTPRDAWRGGAYDLVVLGILEDPSGNRIDRSFDVDRFEQIDPTPAPERRTRRFEVK